VALLEHCVREDLNKRAPRMMAVLRPLKVVIDNYPEDQVEDLDAINNPEDPTAGTRKVPFSRIFYMEREDFREDPPRKFFRLAPGREVRLRYAYFVTCTDVVKDADGEIIELHCTYDPATRGGDSPDGRKVRGTLHWVSAAHAVPAEVRLYDRFFKVENPAAAKDEVDYQSLINPDSLEVLTGCMLEPSLAEVESGTRVQFERLGYFIKDTVDSTADRLVFNRTVTLRDSWAKIEKSLKKKQAPEKGKEKEKAVQPGEDKGIEPIGEEITIEDFSKIDLRVGIIREAGIVEDARKLVRLMVDLGEGRLRQIFAGIRSAYPEPEKLVGKKVMVVANLKPRKMKFGLSEGMILAGVGKKSMGVATFDGELVPGDKVS